MYRPRGAVPGASPGQPRLWLVWHGDDQPDEFRAQCAHPVQISRIGMTVRLLGTSPARGHAAWVALGEDVPDLAELHATQVAEIVSSGRGDCEVQLAFLALCPDDLYRAILKLLPAPAASLW